MQSSVKINFNARKRTYANFISKKVGKLLREKKKMLALHYMLDCDKKFHFQRIEFALKREEIRISKYCCKWN